jgi:single-strand DNA-binding protein
MQMLGGKGDAGGGSAAPRRPAAGGVADTSVSYDEPPFQDDDIPF